jgi:hypothetical protein
MEELKETTAGHLTRFEIGKVVGVVTASGAYIRDRLTGVMYGDEIQGYYKSRVTEKAVSDQPEPPIVLLSFARVSPARERDSFGPPWPNYFDVESNKIATIYQDDRIGGTKRRNAGGES